MYIFRFICFSNDSLLINLNLIHINQLNALKVSNRQFDSLELHTDQFSSLISLINSVKNPAQQFDSLIDSSLEFDSF